MLTVGETFPRLFPDCCRFAVFQALWAEGLTKQIRAVQPRSSQDRLALQQRQKLCPLRKNDGRAHLKNPITPLNPTRIPIRAPGPTVLSLFLGPVRPGNPGADPNQSPATQSGCRPLAKNDVSSRRKKPSGRGYRCSCGHELHRDLHSVGPQHIGPEPIWRNKIGGDYQARENNVSTAGGIATQVVKALDRATGDFAVNVVEKQLVFPPRSL